MDEPILPDYALIGLMVPSGMVTTNQSVNNATYRYLGNNCAYYICTGQKSYNEHF